MGRGGRLASRIRLEWVRLVRRIRQEWGTLDRRIRQEWGTLDRRIKSGEDWLGGVISGEYILSAGDKEMHVAIHGKPSYYTYTRISVISLARVKYNKYLTRTVVSLQSVHCEGWG